MLKVNDTYQLFKNEVSIQATLRRLGLGPTFGISCSAEARNTDCGRARYILLLILMTVLYSVISYAVPKEHPSCIPGSKLQKMRSKELLDLVTADQKEREHFEKMTRDEMIRLNEKDKIRRKRVAEIMSECGFTTAEDYAAASLIFQHGDVSDHYYLAFIWANKAVALGDPKQKSLVALTIDRYLVSIGKKQLFGSQFQASDANGWCFCLEPVEPTFPDSTRMAYLKKSFNDQIQFLKILNKGKKNCKNKVCPTKLSSTTKGSIVGFW